MAQDDMKFGTPAGTIYETNFKVATEMSETTEGVATYRNRTVLLFCYVVFAFAVIKCNIYENNCIQLCV